MIFTRPSALEWRNRLRPRAILLGVVIGSVTGLHASFGIVIVYWLILGLVGAAAQSILVTALYRYATTGKLGFGVPRT